MMVRAFRDQRDLRHEAERLDEVGEHDRPRDRVARLVIIPFVEAIERLGPLTNKGSSLLIMAIVGGAVVPYLQGVLADHIGVQASFILPLLCYGYIIFYGLVGARTPASATQGG